MTDDLYWQDEIYVGGDLPPGFRIEIFGEFEDHSQLPRVPGSRQRYRVSQAFRKEQDHWCGGATTLTCPGCDNELVKVFEFDCQDERINQTIEWNRPSLIFVACAHCTLASEGYLVFHDTSGNPARIEKLDERPTTIMCDPDSTPRRTPISLVPLERSDYPLDDESLERIDNRWPPTTCLHQIGGVPPIGGRLSIPCPTCQIEMRFIGVIDHDDKNFPLFENERPVSLQIGDAQHLNLSCCDKCGIIAYTIAE